MPIRTCVGCRERLEHAELVRIRATPDGLARGRGPGRGAYVCPDRACLDAAIARKAIGWALRAKELRADDEEVNWLLAELYARIGDFEQALSFEPEPGIGQLFWQRRYGELIPLAEDVLIERPNETLNTYTLARAYLAEEKFQLAAGILQRAGLPERALNETRRSTDGEAAMALADAWINSGNVEAAEELAAWLTDFFGRLNETAASDDSWSLTQMACGQSLLGRTEDSLESIERAVNASGLAWLPVLRDMP